MSICFADFSGLRNGRNKLTPVCEAMCAHVESEKSDSGVWYAIVASPCTVYGGCFMLF